MRGRSWTTWLTFRSLATGIVALGAVYILDTGALPRLEQETRGLGTAAPLGILTTIRPYLIYIPATTIGVAFIGLVVRPLRGILAPIAVLLSIASVAAVLGGL